MEQLSLACRIFKSRICRYIWDYTRCWLVYEYWLTLMKSMMWDYVGVEELPTNLEVAPIQY